MAWRPRSTRRRVSRLRWVIAAGLVLLAPAPARAAPGADAVPGGPKRGLIVQTFGPSFEPFRIAATAFRTELAQRRPDPIEFYEVSLESGALPEGEVKQPLVEYVRLLGAERPFDLVVPIGLPALRFCMRQHDALFPGTPVLAAALEQRHLERVDLGGYATAVTIHVGLEGLVEDILHVRPATSAISVVIGGSPLEQLWKEEMRRAWARYDGRVAFTWLDGMTLAQTQAHVAALPPDAAVIVSIMDRDAAGVPHGQNRVLGLLHAATSAPL